MESEHIQSAKRKENETKTPVSQELKSQQNYSSEKKKTSPDKQLREYVTNRPVLHETRKGILYWNKRILDSNFNSHENTSKKKKKYENYKRVETCI